jgi:hypothetical protein
MTKQGSQYEGRDKSYMDIDRMINEGMAGGTVTGRYDHEQIEECRPLYEEEPPVERENHEHRHKK